MNRRLLLSLAFVLGVSGTARAEVIITPFAGAVFAGQTDESHATYGIGLGFLGGGVFGFEAEFAWTPDFFGTGTQTTSTNRVRAANFDLILAIPLSAVRFYGEVGVGVLQSELSGSTTFGLDSTNGGYNVGGGLIISLGRHIALRGDGRYFKTWGDVSGTGASGVTFGKLDYGRVTGGLMFKF
jgi:hypothetical protein